jgi:hypothetical protein
MYINKRIYGIKNEIMSLYKNFLSIKKTEIFLAIFLYYFIFISSTHTKNTTILSIPFLNFG